MIEPVELVRALRQTKAPAAIRQQPLDYDPAHYRRLCDLSKRPSNIDLFKYMEDYRYVAETQPDLLKFLLPRLLQAWGEELLDLANDYAGFAEHCLAAFASKPLHPAYLDEDQFRAASRYVEALILERMALETSLRHVGMRSSPYKWFYALGSFAVVFPHLKGLWEKWWGMSREPHALCAAQYLSCLLYEDEENPVFSPWTPLGGGGAPSLWETDGHIFDQGTLPENISFLEKTLTVDYAKEHLALARTVIVRPDNRSIVDRMLADFDSKCSLLEHRLKALPLLLAQPKANVMKWTDLPWQPDS